MNQVHRDIILKMQQDEITEHRLYQKLAARTKGPNGEVLARIAKEEWDHSQTWRKYSGQDLAPQGFKVWFYGLLGGIFGLTFVINLMELGEERAQETYQMLSADVPEAMELYRQEVEHEALLAAMIDEERLKYIGSMVLGLNDALVELTGALAGFTLALGSTTTVAMAGFITGSAATLSMAASEYLAKKAEPGQEHPLKAAVYTGFAYMVTVTMLLLPYFLISNPLIALAFCLFDAALVIFAFTFFVSVVRQTAFRPAFLEMICISFGVAAVSFLIGLAAKTWLGIEA